MKNKGECPSSSPDGYAEYRILRTCFLKVEGVLSALADVTRIRVSVKASNLRLSSKVIALSERIAEGLRELSRRNSVECESLRS